MTAERKAPYAAAALLALVAALAIAPGSARAQAQPIFNNGNIAAVDNAPTWPTAFQLTAQTMVV